MKAILQDRYGPPHEVLHLRETDTPVPKDDEVLVRVRAASVHPDVWHMVHGLPYVLRIMGAGLRRPNNPIPGTDIAGVVEATGEQATRFRPGHEVFGETLKSHQWYNGGAYAEYVAVPQDALARKPDNVSFEEAAAVATSALIALHSVESEAQVQAGQNVLVNGAAGGVGVFAVMIAKANGAHVTAIDHTTKLDLLHSIGAENALDHTEHDYTKADERYDVIIDIPGNHPFKRCRRALSPGGTYVLIGHDQYRTRGRRVLGGLPRAIGLIARSRFTTQLPKTDFKVAPKKESMQRIKTLLETGQLTPPIDRTYPLEKVGEAIEHLAKGGVRGKIVITI